MNLKVSCKPQEGYNKIFNIGELRMEFTNFGLIKLAKGGKYESDTKETEVALVLIGGNFAIEGDGFKFEITDGRKSPFTGKPHTVYMPRHVKYTITALSDVELAFQSSPVTRDTAKPTLIKPSETRHLDIGKGNFFRTSEVMIDEKFDSEHFYIGEGMIPNGNWSGYPPHKHDVTDPEHGELDMEETYFYLFDPGQGFGFQAVYKSDGSVNEGYRVQAYDTVAIADGYHPLVGAPGYNMYYLWTMAGDKGRGLKSSMDSAHTWVLKA